MGEDKPLLHGAAVSMCAPRVVAVIADFMVGWCRLTLLNPS